MTNLIDSLTGRTVRMVRTGAEVTVGRRLGAGGQGVVYEATLGSRPLALKWLRGGPRIEQQRASIDQLITRGQPHPAFTWPIDMVAADGWSGFGYLMPLLDKQKFTSLAAMLNSPDQPSFRVLVTISRELVDAFAALHGSGLCYRDINFGNLQVDVDRAEVAIIDIDNVGIDGADVFVRGTPRFMAPEIVRGDSLPCTVTDLYSLSVLLFHLFMHGHPLEGSRTDSSYNWSAAHISESDMALLHYGIEPVFVYDPKDLSNRPLPGDAVEVWWQIYPQFLQRVFERAFTTGIWDASLSGRVTEGVWRRTLARLADCISQCPHCRAARFWDPHVPDRKCWNCRAAAPRPPLLEVHNQQIVLSEGAPITSHHLSRDKNYRRAIGVVEAHPNRPGALVVRNLSRRPWHIRPVGEEPKTVDPNQRMAVRAMTVDFGPIGRDGPVEGRIHDGADDIRGAQG